MQWMNLFTNSYTNRKKNNEDQYRKKKDNMLQFMFSWFARAKNMHKLPRKTVQLYFFTQKDA